MSDVPDLGPCCCCGGTKRVRNIIMLPRRARSLARGGDAWSAGCPPMARRMWRVTGAWRRVLAPAR